MYKIYFKSISPANKLFEGGFFEVLAEMKFIHGNRKASDFKGVLKIVRGA